MCLVVVIGAGAILGLAAPAMGATVSIDTTIDPDSRIDEILEQRVVFAARPGERNRVRMSVDHGIVRVRDGGAPLTAGEGCQPSADGVRCEADYLNEVSADLGDGDDSFILMGSLGGPFVTRRCTGYITIADGEGDDVVSGSRDSDMFLDGEGADVYRGGRGDDVFTAGPGADRMAGGPGDDTACYSERRGGVRVSLDARANDGARGERDRVGSGIEHVVGGRGGDVLIGGRHADLLIGGPGGDRLIGRRGRDILRGGPGGDRLLAVDGYGDRVDCGPGRGDRAAIDRIDLERRCEAIARRGTRGRFR